MKIFSSEFFSIQANLSILYYINELFGISPALPPIAAYVEKLHALPNDEWSSDTECEQKASSPGE